MAQVCSLVFYPTAFASFGVASHWLLKLYPLRGTFSAAFSVMWEVPQSGSGDEIEAGIFCLLFCAFLLATFPIWVAILFFSRNYKDPN